MPANTPSDIYLRPVELTRNLLRFNTTNPPGNEAACILYVEGLLKNAGIETTIVSRDPARPNLIARLNGRGEAPAILLHGHVDVVTTANQDWQHDPFGGEIVDGYLWGRGSIDMKGSVAMMILRSLRARAEAFVPAGDVLLAVLSDEEQGGDYGAMWLAENHPDLFEGVKYSFGEAGGETSHIEGLKVTPSRSARSRFADFRLPCAVPAAMAPSPCGAARCPGSASSSRPSTPSAFPSTSPRSSNLSSRVSPPLCPLPALPVCWLCSTQPPLTTCWMASASSVG